MIAGYPVPIRQVWDDRIAIYDYSNLGADHRHWLNALPTSADVERASLRATARPPQMTINILSSRSQKAGLSGHHCPMGRSYWRWLGDRLCPCMTG